jgi:IS5 family transposase
MSEQPTFAAMAWQQKGKVTRRERFLAEMDAVVPWKRLRRLIAPHYPQLGQTGRQPYALDVMLRLYCVQQWFALSDPAAEDALYDSEAIRRFVGLELGVDAVPDESTILRFRHLLERHALPARIFAMVRSLLEERQLLLKAGTIVDATIIAAPSSTKNASGTRDPEMRQTRKGKTWHFGMKIHVGTDPRGVVHSVAVTDAAVADITQLERLLHGAERVVYGDQAYWREADRQRFAQQGVRYRVNRRGTTHRPLTAYQRWLNRTRSRTRALGEASFLVVKHLWRYVKVRYRGLAKNAAQVFTLLALANLYRLRHALAPTGP